MRRGLVRMQRALALPGLAVVLAALATAGHDAQAQAPQPGAEPAARPACGVLLSCRTQAADPLRREGWAMRLAPTEAFVPPSLGEMVGAERLREWNDEQRRAAAGDRDDGHALDNPLVGQAFLEQVFAPGGALAEPPRTAPSALRAGALELAAGRFAAARQRLGQALAFALREGEPALAAAAHANLGVVEAAEGRFAAARHEFEQAQAGYAALPPDTDSSHAARIRRQVEAILRRSAAAGAAAAAAVPHAEIDDASDDRDPAEGPVRALSLPTSPVLPGTEAPVGVLRCLLNLANLAAQLGQFAEAEALLERATRQAGRLPQPEFARLVAVEQSVLYRQTRRFDLAADRYRRAADGPPIGEPVLRTLGVDLLALGAGAAPAAAVLEGDQLRASRSAEAALQRMQADALQRERQGDRAGAFEAHGRAAMMAAVLGSPEREREALARMAALSEAEGAWPAAIVYGKLAVNLAQRQRVEVGAMERRARLAYLADKRRGYAALAAALIGQGRLAEAEHALRLLKEDEGQPFAATAGGSAPAARGSLPFSTAEAGWLARRTALQARLKPLCERQACGIYGIGLEDRRAQEADLRARLQAVEEVLSKWDGWDLERTDPDDADEPDRRATLAEAREILARPPAARSARQREQLAGLLIARRALLDVTEALASALRSLQRQARAFVDGADPAFLERVGRAVARAQQQRDLDLRKTAFLAALPVPPLPPQASALLPVMTAGLSGRLAQWEGEREVEALDAERTALDAELRRLPAAGAVPSFAADDAARLDSGRELVARLPAGTAALYYLPGEQRLDILLVTREGRRAFSQPVARPQLEQRIRDFRALLQNPRADPRPAARALHDQLIAPVAEALREARATTLMLALDGQLRYLPFAALHDGQGWLAERYALDLYTTAAASALTAPPARPWRAAAFGSSAGGQGFGPLPAVRAELEGVVRDTAAKSGGALPGVARLDGEFTAAALRAALKSPANVVHIASHFAFRPGDASASFLLLGDGGRLTLAELAAPAYRFDHVDLVTLSACETALAGDDAFGQEVEGLGNLLQGQGAAAVLATLWSVADDSTAALMRSMYGLREQRGLTRAQALREAQLGLMRGTGTGTGAVPAAATAARGAARVGGEAAGSGWADDPARPHAHPYYWAPFVLMGNWL